MLRVEVSRKPVNCCQRIIDASLFFVRRRPVAAQGLPLRAPRKARV